MLKKIIKRDGSIEDMMPSKVNKWSEWAAGELQGRLDWHSIVMDAVSDLKEVATSQELQEALIKRCRELKDWPGNMMAGKLYSVWLSKKIHGGLEYPTLISLHRKLQVAGLMTYLAYSEEEYRELQGYMDHSRDFNAPWFSLHHVREKYSLINNLTGEEYETQQYVYMRMAMALAETQPIDRRMDDAKNWYDEFSLKRINAPTPNFTNLGTPLRGYASCCLYTTHDSAVSLAIGDHIAYMMTVMSAGIGNNINTRSIGDPIAGGSIVHQGRLPYYRAQAGAVRANLKNGRNGASTTYFSAFDPEAEIFNMLKNPKSVEDKKIRDLDYGIISNKLFAKKVANNEDIFVFNSFTAPDLWQAFFSGDSENFNRIYEKYEADESFKKTYVSARNLIIQAMTQAFETGRHYQMWADEANHHTPFIEPIYSTNLCTEIFEPTMGYSSMQDLYSTEDHGRGEVALCTLGATVLPNITSDEQYAKTMYYTLLMASKCVHMAEYVLPHVGVTAKARMNAGIGVTGLAQWMAVNGFKYTTPEGKAAMHTLAETHTWHAINASLKLSKEIGLAPWMHKTKWPEGWLPIDTYNRNVDDVAPPIYKRDWEAKRQEVIANGGLAHSCLVAHMPTESSSKASGPPNQLYPIRALAMLKSDTSTVVDWCAPDGDILGDAYQLAWDIPFNDMIDTYAIWQKFTDQGISADAYRRVLGNDSVGTKEMIRNYLYMTKMGMKSRYYQNSQTSVGTNLLASGGSQAPAAPTPIQSVQATDWDGKPVEMSSIGGFSEIVNDGGNCVGSCSI